MEKKNRMGQVGKRRKNLCVGGGARAILSLGEKEKPPLLGEGEKKKEPLLPKGK